MTLPPPPGYKTAVHHYSIEGSAPARRAGVMLWVLGGLSLIIGLFALLMLQVDPQELLKSLPPNTQLPVPQEQMPHYVHQSLVGVSGFGIGLAAVMILGGFLVRRGRIIPTVFTLILVCLCGFYWLMAALDGVLLLLGGNPAGAVALVFAGGIAFAFGLCAFWLIKSVQAIKSGAMQRHSIRPDEIQNPPGYVAGYGVQPSVPLPPPPENLS